jgi:hypothetical protein
MKEIGEPSPSTGVRRPTYVEAYDQTKWDLFKDGIITILALIGSLTIIAITLLGFARMFGLL